MQKKPAIPVRTVVMYPRPHIDTIAGYWLLREFGEELFPGITTAKLEFWNKVPPGKTAEEWEAEGYILLDLGGGKFDHHQEEHFNNKNICATTLIARYLGIDERPELKKFIEFVRRDDLEGKGTVSKDVIDRAFGLSATTMNLNRDYPDHPEFVVDLVCRIFLAHYHEEYRRKVLMPQEWSEMLQQGKASVFEIPTTRGPQKVVLMESDSQTIVGYVRAVKSVTADIVVQRHTDGHTNIVTRQTGLRFNLRPVVVALRKAEAVRRQLELLDIKQEDWEKPGRMEGIDEWFFDVAANTIQNGGVDITGISPTRLTLDDIKHILTETVPAALPQREREYDEEDPPPRRMSLRSLPNRSGFRPGNQH